MTKQEFAQSIKRKYPQYNSLDDNTLADKMLAKYPQYQSQITESVSTPVEQPKKFSLLSTAKNVFNKVSNTFAELNKGVVKGAANTALGLGELGAKGLNYLTGNKKDNQNITDTTNLLRTKVTPSNTTQKIGSLVESGAELLTPTGEAGLSAKLLSKGTKSAKLLATGTKLLAGGTQLGTQTLLKTGDIKQAKKDVIIGGLITGVMTPLETIAKSLYQSALKPARTLAKGEATKLVATGLKERIWLTEGGVQSVARKIDSFESQLGDAIEVAKNNNEVISLSGMKSYLEDAKEFFKYDVDVTTAKENIKKIDDILKGLKKEYGDTVPIEVAQKIKVSTGQQLHKYYNSLTSAGIEGRKQATRYLKDAIVEKAPIVGDINNRLRSLYQFDKHLEKAVNRSKNYNLLGLPAKIGSALGGVKGGAIGLLLQLADSASLKSGAAIGINELSKLGKNGIIPLKVLLRELTKYVNQTEESPTSLQSGSYNISNPYQ